MFRQSETLIAGWSTPSRFPPIRSRRQFPSTHAHAVEQAGFRAAFLTRLGVAIHALAESIPSSTRWR
jgi:hypothetical protein